jgi:VanZ family protein
MLRHTRHPALWFAALGIWFGVLWMLSSTPSPGPRIEINHLDKVLHFGYFLGGGFLFAGWRFRLADGRLPWGRIIVLTAVTLAVVGGIDEWHQTHTPGRNGGDPGDWLADVLGATTGAWVLKFIHPRLK